MSSEGEERIRQILINNNCEKVDDTLKDILEIIKKYPGLMSGLGNTDQNMQVDEEKIVNPIATDESCAEPMVKVKEERNCNAEKEEFGDPLFEELHNIVKVEVPPPSASVQGEGTSKNRDLNVAAVMPPIQEDVAAVMPPIQEDVAAVMPPIQEDVAAGLPPILEDVRTRTPEGVLLALVKGALLAKVKINWTVCPRTSEAFMECSILNCNYSVPFGKTDDETNEAYKTMKEHIQQMHKKEADELAKADRVAKEKQKQKNFKCPNNPTCKLQFADRKCRDKHEVIHRTCVLCGKKFGKSEISKNPLIMLSHKCQKSDKRSFTDGEDDGHHDDDGQGAPPNKKIKNTR